VHSVPCVQRHMPDDPGCSVPCVQQHLPDIQGRELPCCSDILLSAREVGPPCSPCLQLETSGRQDKLFSFPVFSVTHLPILAMATLLHRSPGSPQHTLVRSGHRSQGLSADCLRRRCHHQAGGQLQWVPETQERVSPSREDEEGNALGAAPVTFRIWKDHCKVVRHTSTLSRPKHLPRLPCLTLDVVHAPLLCPSWYCPKEERFRGAERLLAGRC